MPNTSEKRRGPKSGKHYKRNLEIVRLRLEEKLSTEEISKRFSMHREYIRQLLRKTEGHARTVCSCGNLINNRGNCNSCKKKEREEQRKRREEISLSRNQCTSCGKQENKAKRIFIRIGSDGSRRCSNCAYREDSAFRKMVKESNRKSRQKRLEKNGGKITPEERQRNLIAQKKYRDRKKKEREAKSPTL